MQNFSWSPTTIVKSFGGILVVSEVNLFDLPGIFSLFFARRTLRNSHGVHREFNCVSASLRDIFR